MPKAPLILPDLVHGIHAEDWFACWNLQLGRELHSMDLANQVQWKHPGVRALSMDHLRRGTFGSLFLSPRMTGLWQAARIRSGGWIGLGVPPYPTRKFSNEEMARVLWRADLELRLEEARRVIAPQAPTRIECLFLAEDNAAGRNMVWELKGPETFVMKMRISQCLRIARADSRWLDARVGDDHVAGYWSGKPRGDADPIWEYLVSGLIRCADTEEFERFRPWGFEAGVRASGTHGPIGTPGTPPPPKFLQPESSPSP